MQEINKNILNNFGTQVTKARMIKGLPALNAYDIAHYCQTLINGASTAQLIASMACSDRLDLVDNDPDESKVTPYQLWCENFKAFTLNYLGLELVTHGDPRGAVFKLVVDSSIGDSFGSHAHLCVPCNDAYFCN